MKSARTALATSVLLGGSLLLGVIPAQAAPGDAPPCPATMHSVDPNLNGGSNCMPNSVPTGPIASGNNWSIWAGTPTDIKPGPPPVQPPPYKPLPAPAAPEVPGQVVQVPRGDARPGSVVSGGNRQGPAWGTAGTNAAAPTGETLQSVTPVAGQVPVETPGQVPMTPAEAPAGVPAVVAPVSEAQAVDVLRSATASPAEKDAALAIVTAKIATVLDQAISKAAAGR